MLLAEYFYRTHDPTTLNRQGADSGTRPSLLDLPTPHFLTNTPEYRSAIFTHSPEQLEIAKRVTSEVEAAHFAAKGEKIVTQIVPAGPWWDAEAYHQKYLFKNPSGYQCPTHREHW